MRPPPRGVKGFSLRPQGCPQDFFVVPSAASLVNRKATGCPLFDGPSPAVSPAVIGVDEAVAPGVGV